jgi:hypothetical protein
VFGLTVDKSIRSRIERLITQASSARSSSSQASRFISSLATHPTFIFTPHPLLSTRLIKKPEKFTLDGQTHGLLILYLASLRQYAEQSLPQKSRIREAFLDDLSDLEDPALGKEDKLMVIGRMWRSWGGLLGWGRMEFS